MEIPLLHFYLHKIIILSYFFHGHIPKKLDLKIILVKSDYFKLEQLTLCTVANNNKFYALVLTITVFGFSNVTMLKC